MITCTMTCHNVPFTQLKNPAFFDLNGDIDTLEDYIDAHKISGLTDVNFQVQKFEPSIKIRINAMYFAPKQVNPLFVQQNPAMPNYVHFYQVLPGHSGNPRVADYAYNFYYFVTSQRYVATNTVELTLELDVLNTYGKWFTHLTSRTRVIREHEDRFVQRATTTTTVLDKVDWKDEGFRPQLYHDGSYQINDEGTKKYYLIYKTKGDVAASSTQPIGCFLCSDEWIAGKQNTINQPQTPPMIAGSFCVFFRKDNRYLELKHSESGTTTTVFTGWTVDTLAMAISSESTGIATILAIVRDTYTGKLSTVTVARIAVGNLSLTVASGYRVMTAADFTQLISTGAITLDDINNYNFEQLDIGQGATYWCEPITSVDRSDSHLIKIISIPYRPVVKTENSDGTTSYAGFSYNFTNHLFWLTDLSTQFSAELGETFSIFGGLKTMVPASRTHLDARAILDPKIYNSAFSYAKIVYDSFSFIIEPEKIGFNYYSSDNPATLKFTFKPTNTLNSRMAFKWSFTDSQTSYATTGDYDHYLVAARNNEMLIYSSDYVTYLRTGYNYDVKNKELVNIGRWVGFGMNLGGSVAQAASGGELSKAFGINAGTSASQGLATAILGQMQDENKMQETLAKGQAQSASVQGADDVDLLDFYGGNLLQVYQYQCRSEIRASLDSYFYYYGYACNQFKRPDLSSRYNFNYIECEAVFDDDTDALMPKEIIDLLKEKLLQGVTVFHNFDDLDQTKENYERWLIS